MSGLPRVYIQMAALRDGVITLMWIWWSEWINISEVKMKSKNPVKSVFILITVMNGDF